MTATFEPSSTNPSSPDTDTADVFQEFEAEASRRREKRITGEEQEWSDYTQEVLDALPRTWTRGLLYFIVAFLSITLPWAMLAKIDETGSARGRLELKGNTIKQEAAIPAPVAVMAVHVQEGDVVTAGQILMELDNRSVKDELTQAKTRLEGQEDQLTQLNLVKHQLVLALTAQQRQNQAQELEKLAQVEQSARNAESLQTSYSLQKLEKMLPIDQARQAVINSQTAYELIQGQVRQANIEVERYRGLFDQEVVPEIKLKEVEVSRQESLKQLAQAEAEISQNKLRLSEQEKRYKTTMHQIEAEVKQAELRLEEQQRNQGTLKQSATISMTRAEQQLQEMEAQIVSARVEVEQSKAKMVVLERQIEKYIIQAPIDGVLFQFPTKRPGAVMQPKDLIAEVAPKESALVFRGQIPTAQSESIRTGERRKLVKLKFDEFPYQDYEVVTGRLAWISPDSKVVQTGLESATVYEVEVELEQNCIGAEDQCIPFKPGQPATADVVIRQRRIIDLLLDPFEKLRKGEIKL